WSSPFLLRRQQWQPETEGAPGAFPAHDLDAPPVRVHDALGLLEPDAPASALGGLERGEERLLDEVRRHAAAGVGHLAHHAAALLVAPNGNGAAALHGLHCVRDEVLDHL